MPNLNINPTRMELMRLKTRLKSTLRGHKLLKDREDEMVRQFVGLVQRNKELRERLESETVTALRGFSMSQALMTDQEITEALAMPAYQAEVEASHGAIMGIEIPKLQLIKSQTSQLFPYSLYSTASGLDESITKIYEVIERLIILAEVEKSCDILASEIEKIHRRVNALEHFTIPQIRQEMKRIVMKLDENERSNLVRLMKVKELISDDE